MKLEISKEQCMRLASLEGDGEIGAGLPELRYGWNGPRGRRWNGNTEEWESVEIDPPTQPKSP
jgi:hypothetical protein